MAIETINPATGERSQSYPALTEREIESKLAARAHGEPQLARATIGSATDVLRRAPSCSRRRSSSTAG